MYSPGDFDEELNRVFDGPFGVQSAPLEGLDGVIQYKIPFMVSITVDTLTEQPSDMQQKLIEALIYTRNFIEKEIARVEDATKVCGVVVE